jgi:stage III sporulation protein SpoIIIAA
MANITFSVPNKLKEKMEKYPEINWSEVALDSIRKKIAQIEFLREFTKESEITQEDALRLGREVSERLNKHYKSQ